MKGAYVNKETGERYELIPMCPMCRAPIYWSLISGVMGAEAPAHCANNMSSTRIITDPRNMHICEWEGKVVRMRNGDVRIYNLDNRLVSHRVVPKRFPLP